jgi:hypothetical protein
VHGHRRAGVDLNGLAHLQPGHTLDKRRQIDRAHVRPRQSRKRRISRRKPAERVCAPGDDAEAAAHVFAPVFGHRIL